MHNLLRIKSLYGVTSHHCGKINSVNTEDNTMFMYQSKVIKL